MLNNFAGLQNIVFWIAVVVALAASGLLTYSLVRFQQQAKPDLDLRPNSITELLWALLPLLLLIGLLFFTFRAMQGP